MKNNSTDLKTRTLTFTADPQTYDKGTRINARGQRVKVTGRYTYRRRLKTTNPARTSAHPEKDVLHPTKKVPTRLGFDTSNPYIKAPETLAKEKATDRGEPGYVTSKPTPTAHVGDTTPTPPSKDDGGTAPGMREPINSDNDLPPSPASNPGAVPTDSPENMNDRVRRLMESLVGGKVGAMVIEDITSPVPGTMNVSIKNLTINL